MVLGAEDTHWVSTLAERLQLLSDRTGLSQRELSRRAGLTDVHFGQLLRRAKKSGDDVNAETNTLKGIAAAAGVSYEWLATGQGAPDLPVGIDAPVPADVGSKPLFGALPIWPELRDTAMLLDPSIPAWAFDEVERSHPLATAPITPHQVVKLAKIAMELLPPPAKR